MKSNRVIGGILGTATMFIAADVARSATLSWDADASAANLANGGTGSWSTSAGNKNWYDSVTSSDIAWTAGNDAVFGGTAGTVTVGGGVDPNSITVNTDGYIFTGNLNQKVGTGNVININGDAQFSGLSVVGSTAIASGKTLTLTGVGNTAMRTIAGGSVSVTGNTGVGNMIVNSALTQTGGTATASIGGNNPTIAAGTTGSWTLSGSNNPKITLTNAVNFDIGSAISNVGNGTLDINAGSFSGTGGANVRVGSGSGSIGVVNVAGGDFTLTGTGILYISDSGTGKGTVNVSAGTATVDTIRFGRTNAPAATGTVVGTLSVSGGSLYVGSGGIASGTLAAARSSILLSGGTVGAAADWSSSMAMALSGPVTIKAADANNVARNIALSGNLSGVGPLTKSGDGKLTLASAGYTGATSVTDGILEVNGTIATSGVTVDDGATLQGTGVITNGVSIDGAVSPAGTSVGPLRVGSATFGTGGDLNINLGSAGTSDVLAVTGNLDIANATLNISDLAASGTYVIATYGGTLTGSFAALNLPDGYTINYGTRSNSAISVAVPEPVLSALLPGALLVLGRRPRTKR